MVEVVPYGDVMQFKTQLSAKTKISGVFGQNGRKAYERNIRGILWRRLINTYHEFLIIFNFI